MTPKAGSRRALPGGCCSRSALAAAWPRFRSRDAQGFADVDAESVPTAWPDCLPAGHRETLKRRGKLGEAVTAVITAYAGLAAEARALVREAREDQLQLTEMFDGGRTANGSEPATINLLSSTLFARGAGNQLPNWVVTFHGDADYCDTWDNVFSLRARWTSRLDTVHRACLDHFGAAYRGDGLTDHQVVERLQRLAVTPAWDKIAAGGFLAGAVFGLWAHRAAAEGAEADRLRRLLRRLTQPLAAVA